MHPVLAELGAGLAVRSHGLLAGLGLAVGLAVASSVGLRAGLPWRRVVEASLWALLAGLVGAKLLAVATAVAGGTGAPGWREVLLGVGLDAFGGIAGGAGALAVYSRLQGLRLGELADALAPGLALGLVWGRLGCFLSGCCFGKAGGGPLAVAFPAGSAAHEAHARLGLLGPPFEATYPLHAVQLWEAGGLVLLSALLVWRTPRRRFGGQVALTALLTYSALRLGLELYRGDRARGFVGDPVAAVHLNRLVGVDGGSPTLLSVAQLAAVLVLLVCGWLWLLCSHRRTREIGAHSGPRDRA